MTQEEIDFDFFRCNQLKDIDFATGQIDVVIRTKKPGVTKTSLDVGSLNQDGYVRMWCNRRLRMKHRFLFWLYHGYLPVEVDHNNGIRSDNGIKNLVPSNRKHNTVDKAVRSYKQLTNEEVHSLCLEIAKKDASITELARKFGRSRCQIKGIVSKKYWSEISDNYF